MKAKWARSRPFSIDGRVGARMHRIPVLRSLVCAVLIVPPAVSGADAVDTSRHNSAAALSLRVDSDLVEIPVTVTDKADRVVEDLRKEMFLIYENGVEQTIALFETGETPVSTCLVFDSSGSMATKLHRSVEAVQELLNASISGDEYCLVRFDDRPEVVVRMSPGSAAVATAINRIYPGGWTALLDAMYLGLQEVKLGHNRRKAIVLISDGGDNRSLHTRREIKQFAREADAQIYSIGILSAESLLVQPEEVVGPSLMDNLSHQSGGRLFRIHRIDDLPAAVAKITTALRHQYVLGYYPKDAHHDGKYRRVTVKLNAPNMTSGSRLYWRAGYYAPKE